MALVLLTVAPWKVRVPWEAPPEAVIVPLLATVPETFSDCPAKTVTVWELVRSLMETG